MKYLPPLFALLSLAAAACSERIDLSVGSQSGKLAVNAFISAEPSQQTVWLSQSSPYFAGLRDVLPVAGARVWVNGEELAPNDTAPGQYLTRPDFSVAEGGAARLRVLYDFDRDGAEEEYTAEETMPHRVQLLALGLLPMMDTSRYVPPFGVAATFVRSMADEWFSGDMYYAGADGRRRNMCRRVGNYGAGSIPYGTYKEVAVFTFTTGGTLVMGEGDTLRLCPFDTLLMRVNSIPKSTLDYIAAAQDEVGGSNPMFGGPPANVPANISGSNVVGCLALRNPSQWKGVVLPMNLKTLEDDDAWVAQDGSGRAIRIDGSGAATFASGERVGEVYFKVGKIDAGIRGFHAQPSAELIAPKQFRMLSYNEFAEVVDPLDVNTWIVWKRGRGGFF